ncbi:inositol monophosphatase [Corynebacterium uropygiale]|uniref:Inositol-1-monophosphatase n=1 Tax=Corynebacterium uropygiale TaxID=1775911 RepID=A0A9X1U070_9CORY|nr:inositol monophosphatase family protein [Corynebacterium uropygiale]MCF4006499.1 inositol monophosphatase [Corynebacterium uropygiale]
MTDLAEELRDLAVDIARGAAEIIVEKRRALGDIREYATTKSSAVDPVTVVDTLAEEYIAGELGRRRPEDGLIGEEGSRHTSGSGISWIIDPIDGTVNFLYGIPHFAVSLAAARDGKVIAGAVIDVSSRAVYHAVAGGGAFVDVDGERHELRVNAPRSLGESLVATGFAYTSARREAQARILSSVLPRVRDIRREGSAALDLCSLAAGRVDIYYEHGINCWDYAAGALIAEEAGARVQTPALSAPGSEGNLVWAAAPSVAEDFRAAMEAEGALAPLRQR